MSIRIRKVDGKVVALCAAKSEPKSGDLYLDDNVHHALTIKFEKDFGSMGFLRDDFLNRATVKGANECDSDNEIHGVVCACCGKSSCVGDC
jgi:hypothetical protein